MKTPLHFQLILLALAVFVPLTPARAEAKRVALVIGNGAYGENLALDNPARDADAMAGALKELGFTVFVHKDLDHQGMDEALYQFTDALSKDCLALFFFAGHGIQAQGENYLIPIKSDFRAEYELKHKAFSANMVMESLESAGVPLKVMVLDCCRDNPLARSWKSRSTAANGLATMKESQGTLIAYSTGPGEVAADGTGNNSPYTEELVRVLKSRPKEGLELYEAFRSASREVKSRTGQIPWVTADATMPDYFLVAGDGSVKAPALAAGQIMDDRNSVRLQEVSDQLKQVKQMLAEKSQEPDAPAPSAPVPAPSQDNEQMAAVVNALMEQNRLLQQQLAQQRSSGPSMPNPAPTSNGLPYDETALKQFIVNFDESGELNDPSAISQYYADEVQTFFDKYGLSRSEIRDGRAEYIQKFPYRTYAAQSYQVVGNTASTVTVDYVSRYDLQNASGRTYSGTAYTTMKLNILSPTAFAIYSISQTVKKD